MEAATSTTNSEIAAVPFASGDESLLRLEYQNTVADYLEASRRNRKGLQARWPTLWTFLMLLPYLGLYILLVLPPLRTGRWAGPVSPPDAVSSNLLLALIPPLLPVLGICGMLLYPWRTIRATLGRGTLVVRRIAALLIYAALSVGVALLMRNAKVEANPTVAFWLALAIAPAPALFYLTLWLLNFRRLPNFWRHQRLQQLPSVFEVARVGVCETTAIMQVRYAWSCFSACHETKNLYVLVMIESRFFMIPKRAMTGSDQETQFRSRITEFLPASKLLPRDSAFAVVTQNA